MAYSEFLKDKRGFLVAAAGHGKTYAITKCIEQSPDNEVQLILTHTHAGIASLKEKFKKNKISSSKYHIETISGLAQRYVLSFNLDPLPEQSERTYFHEIVNKAVKLFQYKSIRKIIEYSYASIFVDEYQDCSKLQHEMILNLGINMPIHIFGDPLQGIFDFNDEAVDFERDLSMFKQYELLKTPWRWCVNGNNKQLGDYIFKIREQLLSDANTISLVSSPINQIYLLEYDEDSMFVHINNIIKNINELQYFNSLLILVPDYYKNNIPQGSIEKRAKLKCRIDFTNELYLLEAIDDNSFYSISEEIDDLVVNIKRKIKRYKFISNILKKLFNKTEVNKWFCENHIRHKQKPNKKKGEELALICDFLIANPSYSNCLNLLLFFKDTLRARSLRIGLRNKIIKCVKVAIENDTTVFEEMEQSKNQLRHIGRKIEGKCLGTTLLTKGLEFDTVVIVGAQNFKDKKNFYVAISRACKSLIIFTNSKRLSFDS